MWEPRRSTTRAARRRSLFLCALAGATVAPSACGTGLPTSLEVDPPPAGLEIVLDTLDVEVQNLWVRISAVPAVRQNVVLTWELAAETANPLWCPRSMRKAGRRRFEQPDTARVWGNVPRAYDFRLVVSGATTAGDVVSDTLEIQAPACRDPDRPSLLCNPDSGWTTRGSGDSG